MKFEIKGGKFYMLDGSKKIVYEDLEESVKDLKEIFKTSDMNEDVRIFEVDVSGKDWKIVQVPWSQIVRKLIE